MRMEHLGKQRLTCRHKFCTFALVLIDMIMHCALFLSLDFFLIFMFLCFLPQQLKIKCNYKHASKVSHDALLSDIIDMLYLGCICTLVLGYILFFPVIYFISLISIGEFLIAEDPFQFLLQVR